MTTHRYTGPAPGVLADGRPLAPAQGGIKDVDLDHPDNKALVDAGYLVEEPKAPAKSTDKEASK